ncbi:MAG: F0F1 ATP synthase subunit A [Planctomycetes bacterium]|nr:F0F1 ATP synthase subunit A [Planctomycetota bacterium]
MHPPTFVTALYYILKEHNLLPDFLMDSHRGEQLLGLIVFAWLIIIVLTVVSIIASRNLKKTPGRFQSAFEVIVEKLANLLDSLIGHGGRKYLPVLGTVFVFIFCLNLMGLIPGMMSPTANWNMTIALAVAVIIYVQAVAIRAHGILGYLKHFAGSPKGAIMWALAPLMFPIHLLGELIKPVSLSLRLFGNISGEDMIILSIVGLVKNAGLFAPFPFILLMIMFLLAVFTSFLQAFIFTALTCIYIMILTAHEEESH